MDGGEVLQPGAVLAGKFEVIQVLGRGGMGVVVEVHHRGLGRRVAVKLLLRSGEDREEAAHRFRREAQLASRLTSAHVVRVFDAGTTAHGTPYLVMELLDGNDVARELKRRGVIPPAEAVDWILQACVGVGEAHANGIIHRDIKPANLFLCASRSGVPLLKVTDFGLSKATDADDGGTDEDSLTTTGVALGTPSYMSPEQLVSAKDVDARADVWSLGVVLYRALTGKLPFAGENAAGLAVAIHTGIPLAPSAIEAQIPRGLSDLVLGALARSPSRRPADAFAFARALEPYGSGRFSLETALASLPVSIRRIAAAAPVARAEGEPAPPTEPTLAPTISREPSTRAAFASRARAPTLVLRPRSYNPYVTLVLGLAVAGLGVMAVTMVTRSGQPEPGDGAAGSPSVESDPQGGTVGPPARAALARPAAVGRSRGRQRRAPARASGRRSTSAPASRPRPTTPAATSHPVDLRRPFLARWRPCYGRCVNFREVCR